MVMRRLLVFCCLLTLGCYDAPFERANPNDPNLFFTMTLESSRDTVTPSNPWVAFVLTTDPVFDGYTPRWSIFPADLIYEGDGLFRLVNTPTSPTEVEVTARFLTRSAKKTIILAPDP